jgi:LPXTG-motif cell wall-anchored protein
MTLIVILLVVWLVLAVLGAVLEGLFWLTVVGVVLLIGTAAYGWMKRKAANV